MDSDYMEGLGRKKGARRDPWEGDRNDCPRFLSLEASAEERGANSSLISDFLALE